MLCSAHSVTAAAAPPAAASRLRRAACPLASSASSFTSGAAKLAPQRKSSHGRVAVSRGHTRAMAVEVAKAPSGAAVEKLRFMSAEQAEAIRTKFGSPCYVYDAATLKRQANAALAFPNAYGLTVRYAMKSSPNAAILKIFLDLGLHIDASSGYEVHRAMAAGFPANKISLSSQELPEFFPELIRAGLLLNACSVRQLELYGQAFPGGEVGVRFNPGLGSGGTGKTNVGGPDSSFGIWFELLPEVKAVVAKYNLKVVRVHTHIGSGSDPAIWQKVSGMSLDLCKEFPSVTTLNLGGGYKVGRMAYEKSTELGVVGLPVKAAFEAFAAETGHKLRLEIEPGTFLVANSAALLSTVQDIVTTGSSGRDFIKLDAGMTEVLRPSLYGAQHPLVLVKKGGKPATGDKKYVVVGHCCESGDLMTPAPGEPETISERPLGAAEVGDLCIVEGSGAYCSGMATTNYNSFPQAAEVMLDEAGTPHLIRQRQPYAEIWQNEVALPAGAKV